MLGAHRVIAIDHYPRRLELAKQLGAEILDYREVDVREALDEMTGGIGPDAVHRLRRHGKPRPDASTISSTR